MANVWAIKNGDWSDTTVWNTGALPTSADDVYANNFNVNVNQTITVNSLRNTANTGITAGGTFIFNTANVSAEIIYNLFYSSPSTRLLIISAASGEVICNINGVITNTNATSSNRMIYHSGACKFILNAIRLSHTAGNSSGSYVFYKDSNGEAIINAEISTSNNGFGGNEAILYIGAGKTIVNGNVTGGSNNSVSARAIFFAYGELIINGNVYGAVGNLAGAATISINSSNSNITIIGNVGLGNSKAIYCHPLSSNNNINIVGSIFGGNGVAGVEISGNNLLNHTGIVQASNSSSAITCNSPTTSTVTCTGPFLKNGYIVAIASQTLRINFGSNSYFQFMKSNGEDIDYVSTVEGYNYPLASDVRYGVEYKSGLEIGTCHVPTPDNVRKNIPVDNTVGTSDNVNAEDILEAIQNSTLPIAERLRNVATVESTGAQITGYG